LPKELEVEIINAYRALGERLKIRDPTVAVRSSATAEDLPGASFAGPQDTYLFISGEKPLIKNVIKCFSSLFTPSDLHYRKEKGCHRCEFYQSIEDENRLFLLEEWDTKENLKSHQKSNRFKVLRGAMNLLTEPYEMTFHTVSKSTGMERI